MPRARTTLAETEENLVKKPRARSARVVSVPSEPVTASSRRRPSAATVVSTEPVRKAPTPLRARQYSTVRSFRLLGVVTSICLILIGSGIAIGSLDTGVIDVVAVVNDRNEKINRGEVRDAITGEPVTMRVPVQNSDPRPNGGLTPADPATIPAPLLHDSIEETPVASSTASSTEAAETEVQSTEMSTTTELVAPSAG
jgi:hypothetical protein